jgi:hypothetical protein
MKDPSSAFRCTVGVFGLSLIQSREHPELYGEAHRLESFLKSPCSCAGAGARHYRIIGTALGGWGRRVHPEAVQLENSQQGWIVPQLGPPEVTVRIYRVARPAGFSNDGPGRGLHNAQLAFELRHLGREHGTDRLHFLRSQMAA